MPKAYGYGRVSTGKQRDNQTREDQELYCLQAFTQIYKPKGYEWAGFQFDQESGGKPFSERDKGRIVYFSLEPGDVLIVSQMDRLWRNKVDGIATLDLLDKKGVSRHVGDMGDLSGFAQNDVAIDMVESNLVFAAHIMRKLKSQEMIRKNHVKRGSGMPVTGHAPIGWKVVGTGINRRYRADANERKLVAHFASMHESGMSGYEIAMWCMRRSNIEPFKPTRKWTDAKTVLWAILAMENDYPLIEGRKRFMRALRDGSIRDYPLQPAVTSR